MRLAVVVGTTETAAIPGLSAAGADPEAMAATPAIDAELLTYGAALSGPVPVSPTGCPTPALVTRAARSVAGFETLVVDAGTAVGSAAPTVDLGGSPGADIRTADPVPDAAAVFEAAADLGRSLPDDPLAIGESIPGGTTTALGVLRALGEDIGVSSSLPDNPVERKEQVVAEGLAESAIEAGDCEGDPLRAIAAMGGPVQAGVAGLASGALDAGTDVVLAGGTQQLAVATALRHAGVTDPLTVATTRYVAADDAVDLESADRLDVTLRVTDPGFDSHDHPSMAPFAAGEAKEGVGMGGALATVEDADAGMDALRSTLESIYEEVVGDGP